ncbi:MAG: TetR/AcrR family transcriptional regulator [Bacteroidales bacterium]|jgi:AcrR family transcriptional regulator|nr:TetR/AcrR family transcriptional regulator [Bacteroidales bacterium]MBQ5892303.1 TetR/AcrR family transcriptional regulator [Bacteroidales bacterium]
MQKNNMEEQILLVAKELFMQNGYEGVSTTQVAKAVGCNQALVHYYYRTKQNLFKIICQQEIQKMLKILVDIPQEDISFEDFIENIIEAQIGFLKNNPDAPFFIIGELRHNSEVLKMMRELFSEFGKEIVGKIRMFVEMKQSKGELNDVSVEDLLIDIASLDVMSFVGQVLFTQILEMDSQTQEAFLERRKTHIKKLILSSIKS